jgi:general secretion pathway protein H
MKHLPLSLRAAVQAGFTLIELMVVILLVGLFSALVVPLVTGVGDDGLKLSSRRLAGTVKYLYNEAALSGRPHRLVFDLDGGTFSGRRLEETGELVTLAGTGRDQKLRSGVRFRDVVVAGQGQVSAGQTFTSFYPVGWLDETVIHLQENGDREMTLRLLPLTGTTEIYEGYREFQNLAGKGEHSGR